MFVSLGIQKLQGKMLIEKVRYGLNASFGKEFVEIQVPKAPKVNNNLFFEMSYNGWGVFNIPVTITFKKELGMRFYSG